MTSNHVELQNSVILITQVGDQTYESISAITDQIETLTASLSQVKILVDQRRIGHLNIGARQAGFEVTKRLHVDKMAFFGTPIAMAALINLLARSVGYSRKVFFANSRSEALKWLNQ